MPRLFGAFFIPLHKELTTTAKTDLKQIQIKHNNHERRY